jgi:hypothetical protein
VRAYQAKLLEMVQANMQFALEIAQRFATVRSPVETLRVIEEFTSKRIAMFRKHSKEMADNYQAVKASCQHCRVAPQADDISRTFQTPKNVLIAKPTHEDHIFRYRGRT